MCSEFFNKNMLVMFLTILVWLGDAFSLTSLKAAVLAPIDLPFQSNLSQQCYRKMLGK